MCVAGLFTVPTALRRPPAALSRLPAGIRLRRDIPSQDGPLEQTLKISGFRDDPGEDSGLPVSQSSSDRCSAL